MQFADDPATYFTSDGAAAANLPAEERERLQQQALRHRLEQLLPALPPLAGLAEAQGLDASIALDEAPRLFFPHSLYKAHDTRWLIGREFDRMTAWLQRLVTFDLSSVMGRKFRTIDSWMDALEADCGANIQHSTGTTGTMSLVLRDDKELGDRHRRDMMMRAVWYRSLGLPDDESAMGVIWPATGQGRTSLNSIISNWRRFRGAGDAPILSLYENGLGADYELYVVLARTAQAMGREDIPKPSSHVELMLQEAEHRHAHVDDYVAQLLDTVDQRLRGQRIMFIGGVINLGLVAKAGLARGMESIFAQPSVCNPLGGLKGREAPGGLEEMLRRFVGSTHTMGGYGMTELSSAFTGCKAGRNHVSPWVVAWALDPKNNWQPLPRKGVQEGRAAFLDLSSRAAWNGLATADHITIDYNPCQCGLASPSISPDIIRVTDAEDDLSFTPASPGAMEAALEVLSAA